MGERGPQFLGDVETVQKLLTAVAKKLSDPIYDPKGIDGKIARPPKLSNTVAAIEAFQKRSMALPDGLIDVNGRTWNALIQTLEGVPSGNVNPNAGGGPYFPFPSLPVTSWMTPPLSFGSNRSNGTRPHAGCDLYFPQGTWIYAITDGKVMHGPYSFYCQTFALEIDHGSFLARYGEIQANTLVKTGDQVKAGQKIAKVGHLVGITVPSDMLHLELYNKSAPGPLTVNDASKSKKKADGTPFYRRTDLIDPTANLNQWKTSLPKSH